MSCDLFKSLIHCIFPLPPPSAQFFSPSSSSPTICFLRNEIPPRSRFPSSSSFSSTFPLFHHHRRRRGRCHHHPHYQNNSLASHRLYHYLESRWRWWKARIVVAVLIAVVAVVAVKQ